MAIQLDLDKICAICLQESNDMSSIFDNDENQIRISDKIGICFPEFNDLQEHNKPNIICEVCVRDLNAAYRFHNNCETAVLLFRCSPISHELENDSIVQIKAVHKENVDEMQRVKSLQDDSSNTQTQDTEETKYASEFCEFEELKFTYNEEHLDNESEAAYEAPIDSGSESNTLDDEAQNHLEISEAMSPSEEDTMEPMQKRLKNGNGKIQSFKSHRKHKAKGANSPKICEICGNTYKYQHALNSHMRRHLNVKPFSCECCDKAFVSNVELRRHMRVHTGDKPYGCIYCERKFSDYGSRIKHERTHTGERPFVCQTCHKSFAYAHVLSVHLRTHTGEKKFQCTQCGKGFTKKSYMLAHMEQHRRAAMLILKEEDESHDNTYIKQQSKTILSSVIDHSEGSMEPCITTYIVEEIDGGNNELKVLKDDDEVGYELQHVPCSESTLGMR